MRTSRGKRTPYAVSNRGRVIYVKLQAVIHPLVAVCDGLPLTFFGNEKTAYIRVTEAIRWHRKELADTCGQSGNEEVLAALEGALRAFRTGWTVEE